MNKRAIVLLILYCSISLGEVIWFWQQQRASYTEGHGYLGGELTSFTCFIFITLFYSIIWGVTVELNNTKRKWLILIASIILMFFIGGLIWSINTQSGSHTDIFNN